MCVQVKVLEVMDPPQCQVAKRSEMSLWQIQLLLQGAHYWGADIGQLEKGKSYDLKMFQVREFQSKNYLSKAKDSQIVELEDIRQTVPYSAELQDNSMTILSAKITGVAGLGNIMRCKRRVEPIFSLLHFSFLPLGQPLSNVMFVYWL